VLGSQFLTTLPRREFVNGLAEVIKAGIIADAALFHRLCVHVDDVLRLDPTVLVPIIHDAVWFKVLVVSKDEKEGDLRAILNFGHTVGHAIEAVMQVSAVVLLITVSCWPFLSVLVPVSVSVVPA
jgi:3-dehydroquinate synthetase